MQADSSATFESARHRASGDDVAAALLCADRRTGGNHVHYTASCARLIQRFRTRLEDHSLGRSKAGRNPIVTVLPQASAYRPPLTGLLADSRGSGMFILIKNPGGSAQELRATPWES